MLICMNRPFHVLVLIFHNLRIAICCHSVRNAIHPMAAFSASPIPIWTLLIVICQGLRRFVEKVLQARWKVSVEFKPLAGSVKSQPTQ